MRKATLSISRGLELRVMHPDAGEVKVRLNRVHAQHLSAALRAFAGGPCKGAELNAGTFTDFDVELVEKRERCSVVRLAAPRGGVVRL